MSKDCCGALKNKLKAHFNLSSPLTPKMLRIKLQAKPDVSLLEVAYLIEAEEEEGTLMEEEEEEAISVEEEMTM